MIDSGALPMGWSLVPLGELLTAIDSGKSFKCEERPPEAHEVGVIKVSAVSWGEYQESESKTCVDVDRIEPTNFVRPGDFLFSRANTIELVGACVIVGRVSRRLMLSDKILRLHYATADLKPWVLQYLRSKAGRDQIELLASGNQESMRNIGQERLKQIQIPLPPSNERESISFKLDELLSQLAAASNELSTAQRKLNLYRQSLLKSAVEGALTAEWRGEPTEVDMETGAASADGWAATPNSWRWSTAEAECGFITKGTTPPKSLTSDGEKCVPFLRVTNLTRDGSLNFSDQVFVAEDVHRKFLARSIVRPGDVLMNIVGPPLGQVSMVPSTFPEWNVNQAIAIFRVQPGLLNEFLAFVLLSPGAGRWLQARAKTTAGQTNLTLEVCRGLPVPVPPLAEQAEIVRLLNQQLEALTEQARAIDRAIAMAAAQRQNILRAAFSGQLVPQDPNDEPASVLLERIRAQRNAATDKPSAQRSRRAKISA